MSMLRARKGSCVVEVYPQRQQHMSDLRIPSKALSTMPSSLVPASLKHTSFCFIDRGQRLMDAELKSRRHSLKPQILLR